MPRIELQVDAAPGQIVLAFQCDAQRWGGNRTTFGPVLMLPLQPDPHFPPQHRAEPLVVGGMLKWYPDNDGIAIAAQPWLFNQSCLSITLTDDQIERIEQRRAGQQAVFELQLRVLARAVDGTARVLSTQNAAPLVVARDEWIRTLDMMGYGLRRLIELPPPPSGLGGRWDESVQALARGTARLVGGDPGVALSEARTSIERLVEALGEALGLPRQGGFTPFASGVARALHDRHVKLGNDPYAVLARTVELAIEIFAFASQPGHAGFDASVRHDAELALRLATTLYVYAARLPDFRTVSGALP